jgi:arylsulfatase A-like enzyme
VLFERAVASSSWTQPSMASLFTSTYPSVHHVTRTPDSDVGLSVLSPEFVTLAEFLQGQGFATHAVSSQPFCNALSGFDQGFDQFETVSSVTDSNESRLVMDRALTWVGRQDPDRSWFLYVHVMGPHSPYIPPPEFQGRFTTERVKEVKAILDPMGYKEQVEYLAGAGVQYFSARPELLAELVGLYDEEIAFADEQTGRLWQELESRGMLDRTMFIVLADHGEGFLAHQRFLHGNTLYRELTDVPLIIAYPPLGQGARVKAVVSLLDVYPLLVDLLAGAPPYPMQGVSLLPFIKGHEERDPVMSELIEKGIAKMSGPGYSFFFQPKARFKRDGSTITQEQRTYLFDLAADPDEMNDLAEKQPERVQKLLDTFLEMERENLKIKIKPARSRGLNPEQIEQLKALGYLH